MLSTTEATPPINFAEHFNQLWERRGEVESLYIEFETNHNRHTNESPLSDKIAQAHRNNEARGSVAQEMWARIEILGNEIGQINEILKHSLPTRAAFKISSKIWDKKPKEFGN